jgi:hypothetical protein
MAHPATETYLHLIDAIQDHIQTIAGDNMIARDWVLITGTMRVESNGKDSTVRLITSPRTAAYTVHGLVSLAYDATQAETL